MMVEHVQHCRVGKKRCGLNRLAQLRPIWQQPRYVLLKHVVRAAPAPAVWALHGRLAPQKRRGNVDAFHAAAAPSALFCSDLSSRGLDFHQATARRSRRSLCTFARGVRSAGSGDTAQSSSEWTPSQVDHTQIAGKSNSAKRGRVFKSS